MQSAHGMLVTTQTSLQQSMLVILFCILLAFALQLLAFCGHQQTLFPQPTDQALSICQHTRYRARAAESITW